MREFREDKQYLKGQPQWQRPENEITPALLTLGCKCSKMPGGRFWPLSQDVSTKRNGPLTGEKERRRLRALRALLNQSWVEPHTEIIAFPSEREQSLAIQFLQHYFVCQSNTVATFVKNPHNCQMIKYSKTRPGSRLLSCYTDHF